MTPAGSTHVSRAEFRPDRTAAKSPGTPGRISSSSTRLMVAACTLYPASLPDTSMVSTPSDRLSLVGLMVSPVALPLDSPAGIVMVPGSVPPRT